MCRRVGDEAMVLDRDRDMVVMDQTDDRRTDEYLAEASRPKDNEELEPKDEMKDS